VIDEIRKRLHGVPFVPFALGTSDGHQYSVPTPDHAHISSRGNRVVVYDDEVTTGILGPLRINSLIEQANGE
jgi:hypothetical protein